MRAGAEALADTLPNGQARILEGQTHDIEPSVLGPGSGRVPRAMNLTLSL
jgi:hypothetical protein